jgi:AcrR family transcriptional regulator
MALSPKFRRRKEARPTEIVEAAIEVFTEKGFAAARLDDIAARAGVSKGALYLYFANKEELFHAVVTQTISPNVGRVQLLMETFEGHFADLLPVLPRIFSHVADTTPAGAIAKMVVGESRNFPMLARYWHEEAVGPLLALISAKIKQAQDRGEVRDGDPRLFAIQLAGPMVMGLLWRETMVPVGAAPIDFVALGEQHMRTMMRGLMSSEDTP